jgi:hypothetical protein
MAFASAYRSVGVPLWPSASKFCLLRISDSAATISSCIFVQSVSSKAALKDLYQLGFVVMVCSQVSFWEKHVFDTMPFFQDRDCSILNTPD